jgi:hypothetical protein
VTPLQRETVAIAQAIHGARERLDEQSYPACLASVLEVVTRELSRLTLGEALRATRVDDEGREL